MYKRLSAVFLASALLAGCQSEEAVKVTDTASQIKAAQQMKDDVKSYASTYKTQSTENNKETQTYLGLKKDEDDNQEVTVKNSEEDGKFYVYDKKAILQREGEWVDISKLGGSQLLSMTKPLLYSEQFQLLDKMTAAKYKDHTLTQTINGYDEYLKVFGQSKEDKKAINNLKKTYPDIQNEITFTFDKRNQIEKITNDLKLKNDKTTVHNNAMTTFSEINSVRLDIPGPVKHAKEVGA
ncbi:hypothetical protein [Macrococcus brunensis]|uniref:hypothetical protein n=1 Tax=Macrococcus brunensis TaxID=198483 RepID=UPI001EF0F8CF|nr:hypothetical protein [Macrococcus brunensis]ULG73686.1 hypothetical protein MGG13_08250 [Macrococcus brunensis]